MRKIFFLLFITPLVSLGQRPEYEKAFLLHRPDSVGKFIAYTDIWRTDLYKIFEIGQKSSYTYTINNDSVYQLVIPGSIKDSLPVIDFTRQELVVYIACPQCLATCHHEGGNNEPCHRNACRYKGAWFVRDKKTD